MSEDKAALTGGAVSQTAARKFPSPFPTPADAAARAARLGPSGPQVDMSGPQDVPAHPGYQWSPPDMSGSHNFWRLHGPGGKTWDWDSGTSGPTPVGDPHGWRPNNTSEAPPAEIPAPPGHGPKPMA